MVAVFRIRCDDVAIQIVDVPSNVDEFDFEAAPVRAEIAINIVVLGVDCMLIEAMTMMMPLRTIFDCGNSIEQSEMTNENEIF